MTSDTIKTTAADLADQAGKSADKASDSMKSAAQDAKGASAKLSDHAKDLAGQASDAAVNLYGRANDTLSQAAGSLPDSASAAMAQGQRAFESGSSQVVSQVKKQPLEAILLAAAIGYLVGWATNRG